MNTMTPKKLERDQPFGHQITSYSCSAPSMNWKFAGKSWISSVPRHSQV